MTLTSNLGPCDFAHLQEPMWKVEDDSEVQDIKPNQHSTTARRAEGKRNKVQVCITSLNLIQALTGRCPGHG